METTHFEVATNGFAVDPHEFIDYTDGVMTAYVRALESDGHPCDLSDFRIYVSFQYDYFKYKGWSWHGFLFPVEGEPDGLVVGYKSPLSDSKLGHEMGHAILHYCGEPYKEDSLETFTGKYGLPY